MSTAKRWTRETSSDLFHTKERLRPRLAGNINDLVGVREAVEADGVLDPPSSRRGADVAVHGAVAGAQDLRDRVLVVEHNAAEVAVDAVVEVDHVRVLGPVGVGHRAARDDVAGEREGRGDVVAPGLGDDVDPSPWGKVDGYRHFILYLHLENHPVDRDAVMIAVTRLRLLLTLASTPSNTDIPSELAPPEISSQGIKEEDENNPSSNTNQHGSPLRAVHNQDGSLFVDPHDKGLPALQQGIGRGDPPNQTLLENENGSETELMGADSQQPAKLDDWLSSSDDYQDSKLSRQAATSSISHQSNIVRYKRKQKFKQRRNLERLQLKASDRMEVYLESRGPQPSEPLELQSAPDPSDETHNGQREADQDCRSVASLATSSTTPEKAHSSRQISSISRSYIEDNPHKSADSFADLPPDLRAKAQMIGNIETLGDVWHFFHYMGSQSLFAKQNTLDDVPSASSSDQRLRNLKNGIITLENTNKSTKSMKIVSRVKKRVYLAEVAGKYMEETATRKAEPKKRRERAKEKLEYWMSLGEPLAVMAQRYRIGIILLLPKKLTDKE
ncbi:hypothetical protein V502_10981 [Pseudogymnoascus sp. VKM F-4520 (FW-2644)]|nr:hypothetical protein V502_10981 [Pseudogymnoascus sp. VKM F-4520 (FW-2644)]